MPLFLTKSLSICGQTLTPGKPVLVSVPCFRVQVTSLSLGRRIPKRALIYVWAFLEMRVSKPKIIMADDNHALLRQTVTLLSDEFDVVATAPRPNSPRENPTI
jgi:hypothetical protein